MLNSTRGFERAVDAPTQARHYLDRLLEAWNVDDDLGGVAGLLTTELVSNVVRHAVGQIVLQLSVDELAVHVAVSDGASGVAPKRRDADVGGYGLRLVEELADRWGYQSEAEQKTVWFELRRSNPRSPMVAADDHSSNQTTLADGSKSHPQRRAS